MVLCVMLASWLTTACTKEVDNLYANWSVRFVYNQTNTTGPLRSALNNPGEFCLISFPNGRYLFSSPDGQSVPYTPTASVAGYVKPYGFLSGFIVGTPAVADLNGQSTVAYDSACPNCYENSDITRALHFASASTLQCSRCQCVYDLNNGGHEQSGKSRSLYRYRTVQYNVSTSVVSISN